MGMLQTAKEAPQKAPEAPEREAPAMSPDPQEEGGTDLPEDEGSEDSGEQASSEEQAEYDRAVGALNTVLADPNISETVVQSLQPADKIGSTAKACILLVQQLDEKLNLAKEIILPFTEAVMDRVVELAQRVRGMQFSEKELHALIGSTIEGVLRVFGIEPEEAQSYLDSVGPEAAAKGQQDYQSILNSIDVGAAPAESQAPTQPAAAQAGPRHPAPPQMQGGM